MNPFLISFIILLFSWPLASDHSSRLEIGKPVCGHNLSGNEYEDFRKRADESGNVYDTDTLWNIYDQLNDSIRNVLPDNIEVEIFLSLLNDKEVGIDVIMPENDAYFQKIRCVVMNANFKGKMPSRRYLCIFSFENIDKPLQVAVKRIE
ncbi:MAG TPA: hypothetical protein DIW47_01795 [Bacteroidetes bacterium]|nr:hypothetical protein [Bacteroidota bacterium]